MAKETKKHATKELAQAQTTAIATQEFSEGAWGAENISAKDLIIPKLLAMQGMSQAVADGNAAVGDIVDSITQKVVGNIKNPVKFVPFYTFKTWIESKKNGEKFEYVRQIPMNAMNEDLPTEYTEGEDVMRRDRCINAYVLLPKDMEEEGAAAMPYLISFRRTSYTAGKELSSFIAKLANFKKPAASKVFELKVDRKENDKGKFIVFKVAQGDDTPVAHMNLAYTWYKKVSTSAVKVDDRDLHSEVEHATKTDEAVSY